MKEKDFKRDCEVVSFLLNNELELGEGDFSVQQPCTSSVVSSDSMDHRLDRQKVAQFLREAEKNRRQIEKLEKEMRLIILCKKNGWTNECEELEEYEKMLEEERNAERMTHQKQLEKIRNNVRKFQRQLIDVKPTPELIETLKEHMSEVEISINTLKKEQQSCFAELLIEERTCRQEITAYEKKIENWSVAVKSEPKLPPAPTVKTKLPDKGLPPEVRALEAFLLKTGDLYGGWDQYDHQDFLKVWTKHRGQPNYRAEAKLYLPGKTLEEIIQHEEWYRELIHLQDKKREAVQRWRASKNQERQARIQNQEEAEGMKKETHQHRTEEEKKEMAQQLEKWREEKRRKEEQKEEQRRAEEILERRRAKEKCRRQLEEKLTRKEQLQLKREQEEQKKEMERRKREEEQRELEEKGKEAAKAIKSFNERDLHKVKAKLLETQLKEKEEEERQRRITAKMKEKVDTHVSRDPSRLTRFTKGWEERMKHIGPSGGGPVLQMFHRAVPTWRQDL